MPRTSLCISAGQLVTVGLLAFSMMNASFAQSAADGQRLFADERKGNCLACHQIGDAIGGSKIGPRLVEMKTRFGDRQKLRDMIWDAAKFRADSIMPPFGRHRILTDAEIDSLVRYVESL